ncbi:MAG: saccharopine dehydrogenase NADP-binding domain-containing protein [Bacteroidota bacterium]|nr:saccharopine dehydrogenase NADP-binding domain-containing protein [Bacteroidota bacterium]
MKKILLFGAGKSATVLIEYLKKIATKYQWAVTVADANAAIVAEKVGQHALVKAVGIDINNSLQRILLIQQADVVISMLPPALHFIVAKDCLEWNKHLLTASYVDPAIKEMDKNIAAKGLLFLCEMGLDPGIDHMSAMKIIHDIQQKGGVITGFQSHCGGLVAPESDDTFWHYKISWNPRNVIMAGKSGAVYKEDNKIIHLDYASVFANCSSLGNASIPNLVYYPNRDSLHYMEIYGLTNAATFKRTTIRYNTFCKKWQWIIQSKLTSEDYSYDTNGLSFAAFYEKHFTAIAQSDVGTTNQYLTISQSPKMHQCIKEIGWFDDHLFINKGKCTAAEIFQFILEVKWAMHEDDKDMVLMLHEIEYILNNKKYHHQAELKVIGENATHTAMAKTVGLPLGIAATLLLNNQLTVKGLQIPTHPQIYNLVLPLLAEQGVAFSSITHAI